MLRTARCASRLELHAQIMIRGPEGKWGSRAATPPTAKRAPHEVVIPLLP